MTRRVPRAAALAAGLAVVTFAPGCRHARHAPPDEGTEQVQPERQGAGGAKAGPGRPRVPPSPKGLLSPGAIRDLQGALVRRGLLGEHREGDVDPPTSAALRKFQESQGLAATGFPDRDTLQRLGVDPEEAYRRARE